MRICYHNLIRATYHKDVPVTMHESRTCQVRLIFGHYGCLLIVVPNSDCVQLS